MIYYEASDRLRTHLTGFIAACYSARRQKTLSALPSTMML